MTRPDSATLRDLRERVLAATGPSIALDAQVAACFQVLPTDRVLSGWDGPIIADGVRVHATTTAGGRSRCWRPEPYTDSIDAAVEFVERVLPGWCWHSYSGATVPGAETVLPAACVFKPMPQRVNGPFASGDGAAPALAILNAALSALIAQAEAPDASL